MRRARADVSSKPLLAEAFDAEPKTRRHSADNPAQYEHFREAARKHETGESKEVFERSFRPCRNLRAKSDAKGSQLFQSVIVHLLGLPQNWGSGGDRDWRGWIVGWLEFLSEAGTERAIVDGTADL
jgi:hypothetical protein